MFAAWTVGYRADLAPVQLPALVGVVPVVVPRGGLVRVMSTA